MLAGPVFVSGGAGFVGGHLLRLLGREGVDVYAPTRDELELGDATAVRAFVERTRPSTFFHLAAFSSPARSFEAPAEALLGNVAMTLNLLEAVRYAAPGGTVLLVGSAQIYGEPAAQPATEEMPLEPGNPYAVSKVTSDLLGRQYGAQFGIKVVRMRPFNHAGPGQSEEYVIASLARQVAAAEVSGAKECLLRTGDPDSARDFTDVRDVVAAYVAAAGLDSGAFNVCRGSATSVTELVAMVSAAAKIPVRHEIDPARLRTNEAALLYGSSQKLSHATGWTPTIPLDQTVADTLDWWRAELAR